MISKNVFDVIDSLEELCNVNEPMEVINICDSMIEEAERLKAIAEEELEALEDQEDGD